MDESSSIIEFVDQYYRMNPETEDLLPNGTHLRDGMVVLIEDAGKRTHFLEGSITQPPGRIHELFIKNRWCTVSHVSVSDGTQFVEFVGVYEDGSKAKRREHVWQAWLVKLDSIPEIVHQIEELVPQHYEMDPKIERLLPDASYFDDGMRVLTASSRHREVVTHDMTLAQLAEARIANRWCAVSNTQTQNNCRSFTFTATYDDGLVVTRTSHVSESWLVKVESIPLPSAAGLSSYSDRRPG